jgi:hypothetical protein
MPAPAGTVKPIPTGLPAGFPFAESDTRYVELFKDVGLPAPNPPGYEFLFDTKIDVAGWKEIRVWVHVSVPNYHTTPVTDTAELLLSFMHDWGSADSFNYEMATIPYSTVTSFIDGYAIKPIIGHELRLRCAPSGMPPRPYTLSVTYLLVR